MENHRIYRLILWSLALAALCVYVFLFIRLGSKFSPDYEDELPYWFSSLNFSEYNALHTTFCIEENIAPVTGGDWYGPGYAILFGLVVKLAGTNGFLWFNLLLVILTGLLILRWRIESHLKQWVVAVMLLSPAVFYYTFHFMPVAFDMLMGVFLIGMMIRISQSKGTYGQVFLFLALVLCASLLKQNFIFFGFGALAWARNWKSFLLIGAGAALVGGITIVFGGYFCAPAHANSLKAISSLLKFDFPGFIASLKETILRNYWPPLQPGSIPAPFRVGYFMLFILPPMHLLIGWWKKDRALLSFGLAACSTMLAFFLLYQTAWFFLVRLSLPILLTCVAGMTLWRFPAAPYLRSGALIGILISFLLAISLVGQVVSDKKATTLRVEKSVAGFAELGDIIKGEEQVINILYDLDLVWSYGGVEFDLSLPRITREGKFIRYTVNLRYPDSELLGKLPIRYFLSPGPAKIPGAKLVKAASFFHLYALNP